MIDREIDYDLRWKSAYIPPKFWGLTLDDWTPQSDSGRKALTAARHFVDTLPERRRTPESGDDRDARALIGVGLSIVGNPGTGKTDLSCAILTDAHLTWDMTICYARASEFISACVRYANPPADDDERADPSGIYQKAARLRQRAARASVTVLGDLGKEHKTNSGFSQRIINNFLRYRHELGRPTVVSSNEPHVKWAIYDAALPSFAHEALPAITLVGADLRAR